MAAPRALWKGVLKVSELSAGITLYSAASISERIKFHTLNRTTGNCVKRQLIDPATRKPVPPEDQAKGFETSKDQYVLLDPEEIAAAIPQSDKALTVQTFVPFSDVDPVFFDKPYYVAPQANYPDAAFYVLLDAMKSKRVSALAKAVLFRRIRTVAILPQETGFIAHTLHFDYEVRDRADVFDDIPDLKIKGEMLQIAKHIITTKTGEFDISKFDDRYDFALAELVKAKMAGKTIRPKKPERAPNVVNLLDALKQSAKLSVPKPATAPKRKRAA